ncbi:transposase [Streptomyces sp. ISL-44]|uniref:transposase n=1 Tax=Streptomyces sp. ISL-44 TaxID=2819184 RepID=UPI001BE7235A|nr:transposase [Streptomyces sp. ISL-44]
MHHRHELADHEWKLIAPLLPQATAGRPRVNDRQILNAMVYKIRTGSSSEPSRWPPNTTVTARPKLTAC